MVASEIGKKTTMSGGITHVRPDTAEYVQANIYGTIINRSPIFEGDHHVRSAFFKMKRGDIIPDHRHREWVQVAVLSGRMMVQQDVAGEFIVEVGEVYFLDPGFPHVETALEDSVLLVTQGEDRPGWIKNRN